MFRAGRASLTRPERAASGFQRWRLLLYHQTASPGARRRRQRIRFAGEGERSKRNKGAAIRIPRSLSRPPTVLNRCSRRRNCSSNEPVAFRRTSVAGDFFSALTSTLRNRRKWRRTHPNQWRGSTPQSAKTFRFSPPICQICHFRAEALPFLGQNYLPLDLPLLPF